MPAKLSKVEAAEWISVLDAVSRSIKRLLELDGEFDR
jgi:hypothetical protein